MAKPPPALTPTPLPPLSVVPGVAGTEDQQALRCPGCHRLVLVPKAYLQANRGANRACPLCGNAVSLPS